MGNKLCCAARGDIDDGDLNQYNQDAIEVFTEASLVDNEENEENREGTEVIEILTKRELKSSPQDEEKPQKISTIWPITHYF